MKYLLLLLLTGCTCKGVIGAAYDSDSVVAYTYSGSPAEKAGVLPGDELIDAKDIPGKKGSEVIFRIIRENKVLTMKATRQCVDDIKEWK